MKSFSNLKTWNWIELMISSLLSFSTKLDGLIYNALDIRIKSLFLDKKNATDFFFFLIFFIKSPGKSSKANNDELTFPIDSLIFQMVEWGSWNIISSHKRLWKCHSHYYDDQNIHYFPCAVEVSFLDTKARRTAQFIPTGVFFLFFNIHWFLMDFPHP